MKGKFIETVIAMYPFIPKVENILSQHSIMYTEQFETDHITFNTDKLMIDPGFARDNKVLDLFLDEDNKILFIGILRVPKENRKKNIGKSIVCQLIDWAKDNHYTIFLDSCGDSFSFWEKCGFSLIEHRYGFDIMGLGTDRQALVEKWKYGKLIFAETH